MLAVVSVSLLLWSMARAQGGIANVHILPKGPTWPNRIVPYVMDKRFSEEEKGKIWKAMKHYEDVTCVKFQPRKKEPGHVRIYKRLPDDVTGYESSFCGSELGYAGPQAHTLLLGNSDCFLHGRLLHEIMHMLGFPHEHSRSDRDKYIHINWDNMPNQGKDLALNFVKWPGRYVKAGPYDYYSLMHYSLYSNSRNGLEKTLVPTQSVDEGRVGQRVDFTETDIQKLKAFYGCKGPAAPAAAAKNRIAKFYEDMDARKLDRDVAKELEQAEMKDDLDPSYWKNFDVKTLW